MATQPTAHRAALAPDGDPPTPLAQALAGFSQELAHIAKRRVAL